MQAAGDRRRTKMRGSNRTSKKTDRRTRSGISGNSRSVRHAKKQKRRTDELLDYGVYTMSVPEAAWTVGEYCLLDLCVSILFYNSRIVFVLFLPGMAVYFHLRKKNLQERRFKTMRHEFLDAMQFTSTALQSGYAMENAVSEALTELRKIYPENAFIVREFRQISSQVKMNVPVERLLDDLADRSHIEDIRNFAEVFYTARKTGGDMIAIVRNTASNIRQKEETLQEIETVLSGKMMEQKIMSIIPLGILAYVRITDSGFLEGMYHTPAGICMMTICMIVYGLAYLWGRSIMNIQV